MQGLYLRSRKFQKVLLILLVCAVWLSWYIRVAPSLNGVGLLSGYGVNSDWTRYHIVRTGGMGNVPYGLTDISSRMNIVADFSEIMLAIYSIIAGKVELIPGLKLLHTLPNLVFFLPCLVGIAFYKKIVDDLRLSDVFLLGVVSLFISPVYINYSNFAFNSNGYGIGILSITFYLMFKIVNQGIEKRLLTLLFIFTALLVSLKHTQGLVATLLLPGYYVVSYLIDFLKSDSHELYNWNERKPLILMITLISIIYFSGTYYSTIVNELAWQLPQLLIGDGDSAFRAAKSSQFQSDLAIQPGLDAIRKVSKIFIRVLYFSLLLIFMMKFVKQDFDFRSSEYRFLFTILTLYPIVLFMFYSYGGIGAGVTRTAGAGAPVIILIMSYFMAKAKNGFGRRVLNLAVVLIIIFILLSSSISIDTSQRFTSAEATSIEFTGEYVDQSDYVFSTSRMGMPLIYYNHKRIVVSRVVYDNWEDRVQKIYFSEQLPATSEAIAKEIKLQTRSDGSPNNKNDVYLLSSKRIVERGIPLQTLLYKSPPQTYFQKINRGYDKVYSSGDGVLYTDSQKKYPI